MYNENDLSLTEATVLALQGKLKLEETKPARKRNNRLKKVESVNVSTDDVTVSTDEAGNTTVETDKEIVTVSQKTTETELPVIDKPIDNETIDVPVEGDKTIVPEEEVSEETVEDIIDEPEEDKDEDENETIEDLELDESKKIQENKKHLNEWIRDDYDLKLFLAYELRNKVPAFEDKIDVNNFEDNEIVNKVYNRLEDKVDYELDQILYDLFPKEMGIEESKKLENKNGFSSKVKTEAIEDPEETKCEDCKNEKCECDSIEQPIEEAKECLKEEEPKYEWVLQGNYGYGWDDLVTYDSKEEAQEDYKTYREEEPEFAHRIRKRLVKEEAKCESKEVKEEAETNVATFDSIANLFKQALTESKLTETSGYENLSRNAKMNEIIKELDNYRGKFPDVETYIWECILASAKLGNTECTISGEALRHITKISDIEDFNKLLLAEDGKVGIIAKMFKNKGFSYTTKTTSGINTDIIISWLNLADRLKFKESKEVKTESCLDMTDFDSTVKEILSILSSKYSINNLEEYDDGDSIGTELIYILKKSDIEKVLPIVFGSGTNHYPEQDYICITDKLYTLDEIDAKRNSLFINNYKDLKIDLIEDSPEEIASIIASNFKKLQESKQTFNKKSFEEALTKFYNFNDERVKSFKVESIARNKKGSIKIEGKLNNKVPAIMIFDKVTEGNSYISYKLKSTNNILKESKDIVTSLFITKKADKLECKRLISE